MLSAESDRQLLRRCLDQAGPIEHSGGSLFEHLTGTAALLESWGAPPALVCAGLFHSIYGTEALRQAAVSPAERAELRAQLGEETEELVYLFGTATRDSLHASTAAAARTDGSALRRVLARVLDAEPGDCVPLDRLLALDDAALVEQCCGPLDVRYLGVISARLLSRAPAALRPRLDALDDATYLALLRAPATCARLLGGQAELASYLEGVLQLEEWRAGARARVDRDCWSASGERYLPAGPDAATATATATASGIAAAAATATEPSAWRDELQKRDDEAFDPRRPYLAPVLGGWIVADLHSPEAVRPLTQLAYKSVPFGPAEVFTADERRAVLTKLEGALAGIAHVSPVATRLLRYTLAAIIPRKQTQPHLYPTSFKGSSTEGAIHRINLFNPHHENVDAARLAQSILHETVHNHLYKRELFQPTLLDEAAGLAVRATSPWSGNIIDLYVFAHSSAVHYTLHRFFAAALALAAVGRAAEGFPLATATWFHDRAAAGFASPSWPRILEEHRELLAPSMARDLLAMRDTVLASAPSLAVEAA